MIRSAHVIGSKTLGGAERFYLRLLAALRAAGEPVRAFVRSGSEVADHVPAGVPAVGTPMRTVWDPWSRSRLMRALRAAAPDVVQTYMGRATRLTRFSPGRGVVHVARLGGYYKLDGYRHAHAWIGNTRGLCDWLVRNGLPAARVYHAGNFIDLPPPMPPDASAALRRALGLPQDALVLVTAGRFVPVKGLGHLLDAVSRLPESVGGRPLRLVLVGDGPLRGALERQAGEARVSGRVLFAGWQTDPAPWYAMADLVVFPSLDEETLGNVTLEAWAHGKPLVTTAFRGARELTRHGEDAWQVPCGDAAALAEGIRTVLTDAGLAGTLAAAGHARVLADFSREAVVRRYLEIYRELLGG